MPTEAEYKDMVGELSRCVARSEDAIGRFTHHRKIHNSHMVMVAVAGVPVITAMKIGYSFTGLAAGAGLLTAYSAWFAHRSKQNQWRESQRIADQAEMLNRLTVIDNADRAWECPWVISKDGPGGTKALVARHSERWEGSWERVYSHALELKQLTPRKRHRRVVASARRVATSLKEAEMIARSENVDVAQWVREALSLL